MHFRLPVTSGSILDSLIELLDPENVGIAVEISLLSHSVPEFYYFRFIKKKVKKVTPIYFARHYRVNLVNSFEMIEVNLRPGL